MVYSHLADSAAQLLELLLYLTAEILIINFFHIAAKIYPKKSVYNKIFSVGKCLSVDKLFVTLHITKLLYAAQYTRIDRAAYAHLPLSLRAYTAQHTIG